ncbi:MAG: DsbA family oxidoreductase, partial [Pseudomonadales bacterium]
MAETVPSSLRIDMVSDVVCPWCAIGYQRLQQALQMFPELIIELTFQPFELNPQMPEEGQNVNEHLAQKYGLDAATIEQNRESLRAIGEGEGVIFNADSESRVYNTFLAHKLLLKAEEIGTQENVKLALMRAYFADLKNISAPEVLLEIAIDNGFSREQAQTALQDETLSEQVRRKEQHYTRMGISAVLTFVFN